MARRPKVQGCKAAWTDRGTAWRRARGEDERRAELARWRRLLLWSVGLTLPVFLTAMVLPMLPAFRPLLKAQVRSHKLIGNVTYLYPWSPS